MGKLIVTGFHKKIVTENCVPQCVYAMTSVVMHIGTDIFRYLSPTLK